MSKQSGQFSNGFYLEPSKMVGGLPVVMHTNPNKQMEFPVFCRNLTGGSRRRRRRRSRKRTLRRKQRSKSRSMRGGRRKNSSNRKRKRGTIKYI